MDNEKYAIALARFGSGTKLKAIECRPLQPSVMKARSSRFAWLAVYAASAALAFWLGSAF
jgi:hypothetical protein